MIWPKIVAWKDYLFWIIHIHLVCYIVVNDINYVSYTVKFANFMDVCMVKQNLCIIGRSKDLIVTDHRIDW